MPQDKEEMPKKTFIQRNNNIVLKTRFNENYTKIPEHIKPCMKWYPISH